MLASAVLLLIAVMVVLFNHWKNLRQNRWLQQFQGPSPTLPVIGNALEFLGHPSTFGEICRANFKKYGSTWKCWLMDQPTLITADPELIKTIVGSPTNLEKHFHYEHGLKMLFGEYGLVTSHSNQWKQDRKLFNQVYNLEYLKTSFKLCANERSYWSRFQSDVEANAGRPIETLSMLRIFYLDVILKSFNVDPTLITEELLRDVGELMEGALELIKIRIMKPWTRNYIYWTLFGYQRILANLHNRLRVAVSSVLDNAATMLDLGKVNDAKVEDTMTTKTMLGLLGDTTKSFQWRYDHLVTIVAAGIDTTAITTTMTLFFLALNPECQQKAHDEIDLLFEEKNGKELDFSDTSKLKYLRMCIKEALRLHAPVPLMGRTTSKDILMDDGRKIPKGAAVAFSITELHRNPKVFPNSKAFIPDRFDEHNLTSIPAYTYIPFSAGPRNCIGQRYADCILPHVLAQILRHFSVKTHQKAEDIKILYEVAGTPYPNVELVFDRRL